MSGRVVGIVELVAAPRGLGVPAWAAGVVGLWLALVGVATWLARGAGAAPGLCIFRRLTGVPCPTCGATRAVLAAGDGRIADAIALNPLVAVAVAAALAVLVMRVGFARRIRLDLAPAGRRAAWAILAGLALANWIYVIAAG